MKLRGLGLALEEARSRWLSLVVVECQTIKGLSGLRQMKSWTNVIIPRSTSQKIWQTLIMQVIG